MPKIFIGEFENAKLIYLCIAECAVLSTLCSRIPFVGFSPFRIMFPYFLNVGRVHFWPVSLGHAAAKEERREKKAATLEASRAKKERKRHINLNLPPSLVVLDVPFALADLSKRT